MICNKGQARMVMPDIWNSFAHTHQLTDTQLDLFKQYATLLQDWSVKINLTTITSAPDILDYHFADSLAAAPLIAKNNYHTIADIGTGGGFPGIPLKIKFPHLTVYLLEVNQKKINFLHEVIRALSLENVIIVDLDWRTFLRTTNYSIDLFCARASLSVKELLRVFASDQYRNVHLLYWASTQWQPTDHEQTYLVEQYPYQVGNKQRVLIQFASHKKSYKVPINGTWK